MIDDLELDALREHNRKLRELLEILSGVSIKITRVKVRAKVLEQKQTDQKIKVRLEPKNE